MAADALKQFAFTALFALLARWNARLVGDHVVAGVAQINDELFPELADGVAPRQLAFFDFVELLLEARSEGDIEDVVKRLDKQATDALTEHGWCKAPLLLLYVFAFDNGGDDRSIGRRPA